MARPKRKTLSAAGATSPIPLNLHISPFNVGFAVDLSAGATLTYTVEHTFDDVFDPSFDAGTATWFPNSVVAGETADADGNYAFPITAIRLNVTAYTGGTATFTVIQAGIRGN
jgi:hypothetical protein